MPNNLKLIRNKLGLTQDATAALMGTTRNQFAKLESSKRRLALHWIERATKAFAVDSGQIATDLPISLIGDQTSDQKQNTGPDHNEGVARDDLLIGLTAALTAFGETEEEPENACGSCLER